MSTISASTTTTTAYKVTADTTGTLVLQTGASPTTAVTIDGSQNVGIGTSSPGAKLAVVGPTGNGLYYSDGTVTTYMGTTGSAIAETGTTTNHPYRFITNGSERARIDTSGNLLVGVTGSAYSGNIQSIMTGAANQFYAVNTNTTDTTVTLFGGRTSGTDRIRIYGNGNIVNVNNSYGVLSDVKLKENVEDASPKLEKLNQVRVVTYNLKTNPQQKLLGVIAQEVEQVFPSLIEETPDLDDEGKPNGDTTKTVKMSVFVPMLIKAIQEQQAIIQQLTARIETLEAK